MSTTSKWQERCLRLGWLWVACLAFCVHFHTLSHEFVWDDGYNVVSNPAIRSLSNVPSFFAEPWGAQAQDTLSRQINTNYYRPVVLTSYALDYAVFGLSPTAFHLVNLLLHTLVSVLVWLLGSRLFGADAATRWGVLLGALIYAVHPLHAEAINVISYRTDLLAGVCYLAVLVLWRPPGGGETPAWVIYGAAPLLYALGLGSKEMAVTIPVAVFALDLLMPWRDVTLIRRLVRVTPMLVVGAGYAVLRSQFLTESTYSFYEGQPAATVLWSMLEVFLLYGRLLICPWPLNPFYDWSVLPPQQSLFAVGPLLGLCLLIGWVGLIVFLWNRRPRLAFLLLLYFVVLLPVSHMVPLVVAAGERFLYIAAAGPIIAVAVVAARWVFVDERRRKLGAVVAGIILLVFASLSVARDVDWQDDGSILEANVRDWPNSYNAWYGLANHYENVGRNAEAQRILERLRSP